MAIAQTKVLNRALQAAADYGDVSAVLMIPNEPVSFRREDGIVRSEGQALSPDEIRDIAVAALGEERLAQIGSEVGQAMVSCALPGVLDGRLCVSQTLGSYSIVIRVLPSRDLAGLAQRLAVPSALIDAAFAPAGLIIITGRSGSGKTTTQYALLSELNDRKACHICTVEYMVGMLIPAHEAIIQQREVGIDVPDCMAGIGASMAQDLDVLMVGELRSVEDLEACIRIAYNGHLVITQLHLPTPEAAIARMCELVDDTTRVQLARSLQAVGAQILLPTTDGSNRVAAFDVLIPDEEMRQAIIDQQNVRQRTTPLPKGCQTFEDAAARLVRDGTVAEADAKEAMLQIM